MLWFYVLLNWLVAHTKKTVIHNHHNLARKEPNDIDTNLDPILAINTSYRHTGCWPINLPDSRADLMLLNCQISMICDLYVSIAKRIISSLWKTCTSEHLHKKWQRNNFCHSLGRLYPSDPSSMWAILETGTPENSGLAFTSLSNQIPAHTSEENTVAFGVKETMPFSDTHPGEHAGVIWQHYTGSGMAIAQCFQETSSNPTSSTLSLFVAFNTTEVSASSCILSSQACSTYITSAKRRILGELTLTLRTKKPW